MRENIQKEKDLTRPEPRQRVDWEKEFDEKFPCIQTGCDNNGSIANQVGEDEWEQQQCQYCDEVRLPIKSFIRSRFSLPAEVKWPELKEAFGQNTFKDGLCHGYNRAINDCKQALENARKG